MDSQSVTQTINVLVGGDLASTGISLLPLIGAAIVLITSGIVAFRFMRRSHKAFKLSFRSFGILALLTVFGASVALSSHGASAAPTLTLAANQNELTVTVPEGGGTASTTTTLTSGTTNPDGYTLTAALSEAEPGIAIKLKGGDVATSTALTAGAPALTLKTTTSASSNDTTTVTLDFTIDNTVTPGKKDLKLTYVATDNGATGPLTMQSFTTAQCNTLAVYDGSNEEAVLTLTDPRGSGQTYQVAKLADGNCWMLNNLKLGSTTSTLTLTPTDSNVASNFTLPQLTTTGTQDYDNPGVYGPVPGDTGSGATNYGYLYNWSAATAGESRTSITSGNAPYSICPANWRLPTIGFNVIPSDSFELEVLSGGNYSTGGTWSLEITAPITTTVGPFAYDVDGSTVAAALEAAVGETVTTNHSGRLDGGGSTTTFSWESLDDTWGININLTDIEQDDGPGLYDAQVVAGPSEYETSGDFPDLDRAFGGTGNYQDSGPSIAKWQYDGPFKGVFAGNWWEEFDGQGGGGVLWSASAYPFGADGAFYAGFVADDVFPAVVVARDYGFGVRCLLQ